MCESPVLLMPYMNNSNQELFEEVYSKPDVTDLELELAHRLVHAVESLEALGEPVDFADVERRST